MSRLLKLKIAAAGFGLVAMVGGAMAQAPAARPHQEAQDLPGPIDSVQDLQDTGKMLFKLADANNDGQISQREAVDAGNLLVGGFFFRADANGDGSISADEARQAREAVLQQKPLLRFVLERVKNANQGQGQGATNPGQALQGLLDTNNDRKLEATEVRQAVQTAVQGFFATADTNRDGQLSPSEVSAAMVATANAAAQAAFQAADTDRDGGISKDEFLKASQAPVNTVFGILDANNDGKITPQEAQNARRIVGSQLRNLQVPEPANSPRRQVESLQPARETSPVPTIPVPRPATAPAPAPAPTIPAPAPAPAQP